MRTVRTVPACLIVLVSFSTLTLLRASEWARWRGPEQTGVSDETHLVSRWSPEGENLIWRGELTGRSTPVVFDGRVCASGRAGDAATKHETVVCWDARTGAKLWEHDFNVYLTAVPFTRVGWANIEGDPETGYLYVHGVSGPFFCLDRKGKVVWFRHLTEEFGHISGYGGRTHSPIVDEGRVIITFSSSGWGDQAQPKHRCFAFDKKDGRLLWVAAPGGRPDPVTTQATPVVATIDGQRLLLMPNGDGWLYALNRTGEKVWGFQLSKQGMNTSVVVDGHKVYATSGDENIDEGTKGRVVCIDGRGKGDITKTNELWRADEIEVGFSSPLLHGGTLYVVDDSANMYAFDAATGRRKWIFNIGTVGKASPVWADGKIYAVEVNGQVWILRPEETQAVSLDHDVIRMPDGRAAEIYGSPAVAYGRVYLATEAGLFCLGDKNARMPAPAAARAAAPERAAEGAAAAIVQVWPYETTGTPGATIPFAAAGFDAAGRATGELKNVTWSLEGLKGTIDARGVLSADPSAGAQSGMVTAQAGDVKGSARVRVFPPLPWNQDFESLEVGKNPAMWVGGSGRFVVAEKDGGKALKKPFMDQGLERTILYIGTPGMSGYTIQADLLGSSKGRKRPDMGLVNAGYTLDVMGAHQRIELRDWEERRLEKRVEFPWDPDVWYTVKLRVDVSGDTAHVKGKVWKTGTPEPAAWTIEVEDTMPIRQGSPALYGYSAADILYDNIHVTVNER